MFEGKDRIEPRPIGFHVLKCWPESYKAIVEGDKTFEIRKNDRDYQVGDILKLYEFNPKTQEYSGYLTTKCVSYLIQGQFGLPEDICVMGLRDAVLIYIPLGQEAVPSDFIPVEIFESAKKVSENPLSSESKTNDLAQNLNSEN